MQLLISITTKTEGTVNLNNLFVIYDTQTKSHHFLRFNNDIMACVNGNRGMGMCYFDRFWYAGIFCVEHRVGSKLLIIDLETGKQEINKLSLTKAIHSVRPYGKCSDHYNMILANSTQNDCMTIITTYDTQVITEDIFFDFLSHKRRLKLDWGKEYVYDDLLHVNDCLIHDDNLYVCMFYDYKLYDEIAEQSINNREKNKRLDPELRRELVNENRFNWRKEASKDRGAVYNLAKDQLLCYTAQPHSIIVNQFGERVFCESYSYNLINIDKKLQVKCKGFTRGLLEDVERGGYWVGSSYHRIFSDSIKGAAIEFVNYDMEVEEFHDLSKLGKEIYDIIPFKKGAWLL